MIKRGSAGYDKQFGYKNPLQVPSWKKSPSNVGLGEATQNVKAHRCVRG